MYEILRRNDYIQKYYDFVYKQYAKYTPSFPVTYYSIDFENSVLENEDLLGGTYESQGIGELSGMVFKKIVLFPVFGIDQVSLQKLSSERGFNYREGLETKAVFSTEYGLRPNVGDFMDLSFGLNNKQLSNNIFSVTNIHKANMGDYVDYYNCILKISPVRTNQIETQITSHWYYLDYINKIVHWDNAKNLIKLEEKSKLLASNINTSVYNTTTGFYLSNG